MGTLIEKVHKIRSEIKPEEAGQKTPVSFPTSIIKEPKLVADIRSETGVRKIEEKENLYFPSNKADSILGEEDAENKKENLPSVFSLTNKDDIINQIREELKLQFPYVSDNRDFYPPSFQERKGDYQPVSIVPQDIGKQQSDEETVFKTTNILTNSSEPRPINNKQHLEKHIRHILKTEDHDRNISVFTPCNLYFVKTEDNRWDITYAPEKKTREEMTVFVINKILSILKERKLQYSDICMQLCCAAFSPKSIPVEKVMEEDIFFPNDIKNFKTFHTLHKTIYKELEEEFILWMKEKEPEKTTDELKTIFNQETIIMCLHMEPDEIHTHRLFIPKLSQTKEIKQEPKPTADTGSIFDDMDFVFNDNE